MSITSYNRKRHLGIDFVVWSGGGSWFWLLINSSGEGGIIGAGASEGQAMRDAFLSIEEKLRSSQPYESENAHSVEPTLSSAHANNQRRY